MLTTKQRKILREKLSTAQHPIYIHDDDPDGLSSFLLLIRKYKEGQGFMLKAAPKLDPRFHPKINHINYDMIVVLDIPQMEQEFIDEAKAPIYWIDHHPVQTMQKVTYYNPRIKDDDAYIPTTRMAWQIVEEKTKSTKEYKEMNQDFWIAMAGCLSDWYMPDFAKKFDKIYPELLTTSEGKMATDIGSALYDTKIGTIAKIFAFLFKGRTKEVYRNIKVLSQINSPYEILNQTTDKGRFLHKVFSKINGAYEAHVKAAGKKRGKSPILHYNYIDSQFSFTSTLATELQFHHKDKVILITRKSEGKYKCSIRAQFPIIEPLQTALEGVEGYGGGHPSACGAVVAEEDWDIFLKTFKRELKEQKVEEKILTKDKKKESKTKKKTVKKKIIKKKSQ